MKALKQFTAAMTLTLAGCSLAMAADQCDISINYDLMVEPNQVVVTQEDDTKYQFRSGELFVDGEAVELSASQRKLVTQYENELATQVPEVIGLVNDTIVLAGEAIGMAMTPLLGESSAQLAELMDNVRDRLDDVASRNGDTYYLGATDSTIEAAFDEEFEKEIEQLMMQSIGTIMMNVGAQLVNSDGENFDDKIEAFSQKMDNIGEEIELAMEARGEAIEARATEMCNEFQQIAKLEAKMRKAIPELASFRLTEADSNQM
ncbi:YggN family protein [Shewanella submarina]|uniref:YggN family protein n=1 Tax=Shewanella submarina TaxID=2016376 RepID=A0ABV7GBZ1_9GAMM|nr:YggN family protein [Shewanella submarina]MCL1036847.1 YggN family protein [Shewanella submarina]